MPPRIAVVGAGWAGLSCAHYLSEGGAAVTVFEASPLAGGRARSARIKLSGQSVTLDNGQHMLIGAYRETLAMLELCGSNDAIDRVPLQFTSPRLSIRRRGPGRLGLAWGFVTARGLSLSARLALARASLHFALARWQGFDGTTVAQLMLRTGQTPELISGFWRPLCVAAMNTEPDQACGQTFVNVLHDALLLSGRGSDFLIANQPLGQVFPEPLARRLRDRGVGLLSPAPVRELAACRSAGIDQWEVKTRDQTYQFDAVVLATPVWGAARLLQQAAPKVADNLRRFKFESIRTVYMNWGIDQTVTLPAITMLSDEPGSDLCGQWLFNRGQHALVGQIAAVIVSAANEVTHSNESLAALVATQVSKQLDLSAPIDAVSVNEKRATFLCEPGRPVVTSDAVDGLRLPRRLALAGDYCLHRYPATLESAVTSGRQAAQYVLADLRAL